MKANLKTIAAMAALAVPVSMPVHAQDYPTRDVTNIVSWAAGGGTDIANRLIAAEMQSILGANINVTNRTGGVAGSAGMAYAYSQPADGYTLSGISSSNVTAAVLGGWENRMDVWYPFIVASSPALVSVSANSSYETLEDLVEAARANPGEIRVAASGAGGGHHIIMMAFAEGLGLDFNFIPYDGSAPSQNAAVTGEVEVVFTLLAEQQQLIHAGRLRPLAMLVENPFEFEGVGTIPSALEVYPELNETLPINLSLAFAVRDDVSDDIKQKLTEAFEQAMTTPAIEDWASQNFYILSGVSGEPAKAEFAATESLFSWRLHELGATTVDPETLGIPQP